LAFPVVLDTCVLFPIALTDLLLRLAEAKAFRPLWSNEILAELERNLVSKGKATPVRARKRVTRMREHFPDALVENYEDLIPIMTCDPKDRHVAAAAVRSNAELIVTFNLKDFPVTALRDYDLEAISPDDFLLDQLDLFPEVTLDCLRRQATDYANPKVTILELLRTLENLGLPLFTAAVRDRIAADDPSFVTHHG
jgi:predicted nucleic acid-binding protein